MLAGFRTSIGMGFVSDNKSFVGSFVSRSTRPLFRIPDTFFPDGFLSQN